ncbi:MAG: WYL domain-containing protein [Bacteroidota bacterium]
MREEYDAPILHDKKRNGYHYTSQFQIPVDLALTQEDFSALELAANTLTQFKHLRVFEAFNNLFFKITHTVNHLIQENQNSHIHFEKVPFYKGTEHIDSCLKAIEYQRIIRFLYHSPHSKTPILHVVHPYELKEHTNRWYLVAWMPEYQSYTPFALDRILSDEVKIMEREFGRDQSFNIETYFEFAIGMTVYHDQPIEDVILEFQPKQAQFFKSKPFHNYDIIEETNDKLIVRLRLIIHQEKRNYELVRKIVSMGDGVKVIQPQVLIDQVKGYLHAALNQY